MIMFDFLLRFRRPRSQQTGDEIAREEPTLDPPAITSYVAQKIHPDLDSLAAELELERTAPSPGPSSIAIKDTLPLSPGTRPRRSSQSQVNAGESTISLSTASSNETRAHRVLKSLATFGKSPPSAWSTFGRKTLRETHSVPHITDFGGSTTSQSHSRNSTSTPSSTWHSHSSPAGDNAMNNTFGSASSPSSGFTFGSRNNGPTIPPLPPLPRMDDNLKHPRPSASLPSMSDNRPMVQYIFNPSQPRGAFLGSKTPGCIPMNSAARRERDARKQRRRRSGSDDGFRKTTPLSPNSSNPVLGSPWSGMTSSAKNKEPQHSIAATPESSPPAAPIASTEKARGKRKADEVEGGGTPPDLRKEKQQHRATFAEEPRPHRASGNSGSSSRAPSSYHRKRARLTYSSNPMAAVGEGNLPRPGSRSEGHSQVNASNTGSGASRISKNNSIVGHHPFRSQSRSSHTQARPPSRSGSTRRPPSLSQASIPISALISPHAPSVSHRSAIFHMRDPRRPAPIQSTPWSLSFPTPADGQTGYLERWKWKNILSRLRGRSEEHKAVERVGWTEGGGSPIHAWLFFLGFILFPVWWLAGFLLRIPKTRRIGDGGIEKGVVLDDPQVEFDARSWRTRCRVMSVISIVTYIPFIVLVAVFVPR